MEHRPRNQNRHQLKRPEHLEGREKGRDKDVGGANRQKGRRSCWQKKEQEQQRGRMSGVFPAVITVKQTCVWSARLPGSRSGSLTAAIFLRYRNAKGQTEQRLKVVLFDWRQNHSCSNKPQIQSEDFTSIAGSTNGCEDTVSYLAQRSQSIPRLNQNGRLKCC